MSGQLDYFVDAEWSRVCGPYVKPPKMDRWQVTAEPHLDLADTKQIIDDMMRQCWEATKPRRLLMEQAVRMVFALGYGPADCTIATQRGVDDLRAPSTEVDLLIVRGDPCFEVKVTRSPVTDLRITYTTTPRLIAWPPDISTAPQDQRSSMSET